MWEIGYFVSNSGKSPIPDFILNLDPNQKTKIIYCIRLLKEYGSNIREPHSKKLTGYSNLFELRTSGSGQVRILYTRQGNRFILLHAFIKKTNKTPRKEIEVGLTRLNITT